MSKIEEKWRERIHIKYIRLIQEISNDSFERHEKNVDMGIGLLNQTFINSMNLIRGSRANFGGMMEVFLIQAIMRRLSQNEDCYFQYPQYEESIQRSLAKSCDNLYENIPIKDGYISIRSNISHKIKSGKHFKPDVELCIYRNNQSYREFFEITTDNKNYEKIIKEIERYTQIEENYLFGLTFIFVDCKAISKDKFKMILKYILTIKEKFRIRFIQYNNDFGEYGSSIPEIVNSIFSVPSSKKI